MRKLQFDKVLSKLDKSEKMSMNVWIGVGRLADQPETRMLDSGTSMSKFTLVTTRLVTKRDGTSFEAEEYTKCTAWGAASDLVVGAAKGDLIGVTGSLKTNKVEKDGVTKWFTGIDINGPNIKLYEKSNEPAVESEQTIQGGW